MQESDLEKLRYPIGKFEFHSSASSSEVKEWIKEIEQLPAVLKKSLKGLNEKQLNTPYREGGWTVKQVVHHIADSHINAYIRVRLALTENHPTIKPYKEALWAELDDAKNLPVEISISLLESLHLRWTHLLKKLSASDYEKTVYHPESNRDMSIKFLMHLYSWHGNHHCAHITSLRKRNKW